jgi:hypothetical protein
MEVRGNRRDLRPAVLIAVVLLHAGLILVLLRAKPADRERPATEPFSTFFFVNPAPRLTLPPPGSSLTPHSARMDRAHHWNPIASSRRIDTTSPLENAPAPVPPPIDWFAEAQHSAVEIAGRAPTGRASVAPVPSTGSPPWDPHPLLPEATGHGLKLWIPVRIPLPWIDHCFSDVDLGQTPYGPEARLQAGCALGKLPARGDLFDSLRKPQPPE